MKKKIELTAEFILGQFSHTFDVDGEIATLSCNSKNSNWIELALDSIDVEYESNEFEDDCGAVRFAPGIGVFNMNDFNTMYSFKLKDIKDECPKLYEELSKMK